MFEFCLNAFPNENFNDFSTSFQGYVKAFSCRFRIPEVNFGLMSLITATIFPESATEIWQFLRFCIFRISMSTFSPLNFCGFFPSSIFKTVSYEHLDTLKKIDFTPKISKILLLNRKHSKFSQYMEIYISEFFVEFG